MEKGKYRHFKGSVYEVIDEVTHSENLEVYVLYCPVDGDGRLWVRPKVMFEEEVLVEGIKVQRFKKID